MTITVYTCPPSFPVRAVLMTVKVLELEDVKYEHLNLFNNDHLKEEFIKINPQHVVPTIIDGDFVLWESRAIMAYLVSTYGKNDSLYPKDLKKRAIVDQRLYFDAGILFTTLRACFFPVFFKGETTVPEDKIAAVKEGLNYLNTYLEGHEFSCGNTLTIADLSLLASATTAEGVGFDITKYKNIKPWIERCKKLVPNYEEANQLGVDQFREAVFARIGPIKF